MNYCSVLTSILFVYVYTHTKKKLPIIPIYDHMKIMYEEGYMKSPLKVDASLPKYLSLVRFTSESDPRDTSFVIVSLK